MLEEIEIEFDVVVLRRELDAIKGDVLGMADRVMQRGVNGFGNYVGIATAGLAGIDIAAVALEKRRAEVIARFHFAGDEPGPVRSGFAVGVANGMSGELIPDEAAFGRFALEVEGVEHGVEPAFPVVGFFGEFLVRFPHPARAIIIGADDGLFADVHVRRRKIFLREHGSFGGARFNEVIVSFGNGSPLEQRHQRGRGMGVRGANAHVLLRDFGLARDALLHAFGEIVRKTEHVEDDDRGAITLGFHHECPCGSGLADTGHDPFQPGGFMESGELHAKWRRDIGNAFASFEHDRIMGRFGGRSNSRDS